MERDINKYTEDYLVSGFEDYQVRYRRKKILEIIKSYKPINILEIGCGFDPLVKYLDSDIKLTIVEPNKVFFNNLSQYRREGDVYINDFFENTVTMLPSEFDMVLCSSLLHEVSHPDVILGGDKKDNGQEYNIACKCS